VRDRAAGRTAALPSSRLLAAGLRHGLLPVRATRFSLRTCVRRHPELAELLFNHRTWLSVQRTICLAKLGGGSTLAPGHLYSGGLLFYGGRGAMDGGLR